MSVVMGHINGARKYRIDSIIFECIIQYNNTFEITKNIKIYI